MASEIQGKMKAVQMVSVPKQVDIKAEYRYIENHEPEKSLAALIRFLAEEFGRDRGDKPARDQS